LPHSPPPIAAHFLVRNQTARAQFFDARAHLCRRKSQSRGERGLIHTAARRRGQTPKNLQLGFRNMKRLQPLAKRPDGATSINCRLASLPDPANCHDWSARGGIAR
jgi:hypothetical protein